MTDGSAAGLKKLYKNIKYKMNNNQKEITHFLLSFEE
jgi:hypothetical protein